MTLPDPFVIQMKNLLGSEYSDFESALREQPPVSIRLNPLKQGHEFSLFQQVPWCEHGYYLDKRPVFTIDPFFHAGHYYVQEASSMFLDFVLKSINLKSNSKVLDLCSAPGGKSTLILSHLKNSGLLHCHEFDPFRMGVLKQNVERWGYSNSIITHGSLSLLVNLEIKYDLILIDAPCSGEGMFRKEKDALTQWSLNKVNQCAGIQKNIMQIADSLCAKDGYIVYSTCTWNQKENEDILYSYISDGKYSPIKIEHGFAIDEYHEQTYTYRLFPHKTKGEGFTVSVIKKDQSAFAEISKPSPQSVPKSDSKINLDHWLQDPANYTVQKNKEKYFAINHQCSENFVSILQKIPSSYLGIPLGEFKGSHFYPSHGLSQSIFINRDLDHVILDQKQAVEYLRASTPEISISTNAQWLLACYKTARLGWFKHGGTGLKNYFPKNQRIISY